MIDARQNPLFLKNKCRSAKSQVSGSPLKTWMTCASAPSYRVTCLTMWQGIKPKRQQSIPSVTQIAVIAVSSISSTINCILQMRTTTSSFNTSRQIPCSLQEWLWQLLSVPAILIRIPLGWMGLSSKKARAPQRGRQEGWGGTSSPQVHMPQPCQWQQEEWALTLQSALQPAEWAQAWETSSVACRGAW
jgi:hypothetical protein